MSQNSTHLPWEALLLERAAVGTSDVTELTRDLPGLIVRQRNDEEVWSGVNQTHGYATLVVERKLKKRLVRAQRDQHEHEHGRHGHDVIERHNEENVVGLDATVLRGEAWAGYDGGRFERREQDIKRNDRSVCDDAQYNSGSFHGRSLLVDLLASELGDGSRGCPPLLRA